MISWAVDAISALGQGIDCIALRQGLGWLWVSWHCVVCVVVLVAVNLEQVMLNNGVPTRQGTDSTGIAKEWGEGS